MAPKRRMTTRQQQRALTGIEQLSSTGAIEEEEES